MVVEIKFENVLAGSAEMKFRIQKVFLHTGVARVIKSYGETEELLKDEGGLKYPDPDVVGRLNLGDEIIYKIGDSQWEIWVNGPARLVRTHPIVEWEFTGYPEYRGPFKDLAYPPTAHLYPVCGFRWMIIHDQNWPPMSYLERLMWEHILLHIQETAGVPYPEMFRIPLPWGTGMLGKTIQVLVTTAADKAEAGGDYIYLIDRAIRVLARSLRLHERTPIGWRELHPDEVEAILYHWDEFEASGMIPKVKYHPKARHPGTLIHYRLHSRRWLDDSPLDSYQNFQKYCHDEFEREIIQCRII